MSVSVERDDSSDSFSLLQQPSLANTVAKILRNRILSGKLADGARLPKQNDLLLEFRVSRPTLREALRILESEGLVMVQRGNVGGAIVRRPDTQSSAITIGDILQARQVPLRDLADALVNLEPVAAALCARKTDRHISVVPHLQKLLDLAGEVLDDGVRYIEYARKFHEDLVQFCGNETLIVTIGTLETLWSQQERQWARLVREEGSYSRAKAVATLRSRKAILNAVDRGDANRAASLARAHMSERQRFSLSREHDAIVQAIRPSDLGEFI